jgi:hypothetical protein
LIEVRWCLSAAFVRLRVVCDYKNMGQTQAPTPVLLIIAASSRYDSALDWTRNKSQSHFGKLGPISEAFSFTETDYYAATMGTGLQKQFLAFETLIDPADLAAIKRRTNCWEAEYASETQHPEPRPLNLDPGYITPAKLVLASTKDHAHRLYLRDGIYAEITLAFRYRKWEPMEWTYPDYRRDDYQWYFTQCREWLLNCGTPGHSIK